MNDRKLPADVARCKGRLEDHPYYINECCHCMRRLSPPHERQVYMAPWDQAHGPCPDKIEMEK